MRIYKAAIVASALLVCAPALAQRGPAERPMPQRDAREPRQQFRLTPEQAEAAWKLEAEGVGRRLELIDETADKVIEVYAEARKEHDEAVQKLREELMGPMPDQPGERARRPGGDRPPADRGEERGRNRDRQDVQPGERGRQFGPGFGQQGAFQELIEEQRTKLEGKLAELLDEKQLEDAMKSLGSFDATWDRLAHTIIEFKLDDATKFTAMDAIETYIVEMIELRQNRGQPGQPQPPQQRRQPPQGDQPQQRGEDMRSAFQKPREDLLKELGKVLTEEQLATIEQSLTRGRMLRGAPRDRGEERARPPRP